MTNEDLSSYWLCPKDGCKLVELAKRNESGIFQIHRKQFEVSLSNAIAVKKILPDQEEDARKLAKLLLARTDELTVSLVSVICNICGFRAIAPKISQVDIKASRKKQLKTISSLTQAAEKKRARYASLASGQSFSIWRLWRYIWLASIFLSFILLVLAGFGITPDKILDLVSNSIHLLKYIV